MAKFKPIRAVGIAVLKEMTIALESMSTQEGTSERRREFVDACGFESSEVNWSFCSICIADNFGIMQIDHDSIMNIIKRVSDSRKKVEEGMAKGLLRICTTYEQ